MNLNKIFSKIIEASFYALFIIVPLILTPVNYELFEFNKMLTVYGLTAIIAAAWVGKMIVNKKVLFSRTPLDIPLMLFLLSQILSTIFSLDRHTSIRVIIPVSIVVFYRQFVISLFTTLSLLMLFLLKKASK